MNHKNADTVKAVLSEAITYNKDGQEILVLKDTPILVDVSRGVALISEDHVDVYPTEYRIIAA